MEQSLIAWQDVWNESIQLHYRESLEEGENLAIHRKLRYKRVLSDYFTGSGRGLLAIMINP